MVDLKVEKSAFEMVALKVGKKVEYSGKKAVKWVVLLANLKAEKRVSLMENQMVD